MNAPWIKNKLFAWSEYRLERFTSPGDILAGRISNQTFLIVIMSSILLSISATGLVIWSVLLQSVQISIWHVAFCAAPLIDAMLGLIFFYLKNKQNKNFVYEFIYGELLIAAVVFCSVIAGTDAGIYLVLLPIIGMSLNVFGEKKMPRYSAQIIVMCSASLLFYGTMNLSPLVELAPIVKNFAKKFLLVFNALLIILVLFYFGWRNRWLPRISALWKRLTERGFELFDNESDKKYRKIQSSTILTYVLVMAMVVAAAGSVTVYFAYVENYVFVKFLTEYILSSSVLIELLLLCCLYFQGQTKASWPALTAFSTGLFYMFFLGITFSRDWLVFMVPVSLMPVPYLFLNKKNSSEKVFSFVGPTACVTALLTGILYHTLYPPLI